MLVLSGVTMDAALFIPSPTAGSGQPRRYSCSMGVRCAGPGSSLGVPGLSSEAYSGLAANKIKPGLRLYVSHASDGSLQMLSRVLGGVSSGYGLLPSNITPILNPLLTTFYVKPPPLRAHRLLRSNFFQWDFSMCSSTFLIWGPSH